MSYDVKYWMRHYKEVRVGHVQQNVLRARSEKTSAANLRVADNLIRAWNTEQLFHRRTRQSSLWTPEDLERTHRWSDYVATMHSWLFAGVSAWAIS